MATFDFLTILVRLIEQGADPGAIVRTTADNSQIPAWLAFILQAFKLRLSCSEMGSQFLECLGLLLDDIDADVIAASPPTGRHPWDILCSHISALWEDSKVYGSVSRDNSVTGDTAQHELAEMTSIRLKFLSSVVRALVERLVSCRVGDSHIHWKDLLVAIDEGFPPRFAKPFTKKLKRLGLVPEDWEPDPVGPAVPFPSASRKRTLAELPVCETGGKRARRCSV